MKKNLWVKVTCLSLFYTNLVYSAVTFEHLPSVAHYKSCPPVTECPNENQLKQDYTEVLNQYSRGSSSSKTALFNLSRKNYSQRLECSMSTFLNEDLPELCPTPSHTRVSRTDRIRNRFSRPTASAPSFSFSINEDSMLPPLAKNYRKKKIPTAQEIHDSNVDRIQNQFSQDVALSNPSFSLDENVMNPSLQELDSLPLLSSPSDSLPESLAKIQRTLVEPNQIQKTQIDPICFHAGSLRGVQAVDQRYECSHYNQISPRKTCAEGHPNCRVSPTSGPCLSQTYAEKLSKTFDRVAECAGLNSADKNNLFAILNHESAFMPNARSSTGARCMGQITQPLVRELSARLTSGLVGGSDSWGLEEVLEKCPELNDYTIPSDIENNLLPYVQKHRGGSTYGNTLKEVHFGKATQAPREHQRTHYPMTCKLTSNPVTCLLHSALYYRLTETHFDRHLPQDSGLISNTDRQKFKNLVLKISYNFGYSMANTYLQGFLQEIDCTSGSCSNRVFKEKLDQGEQINAQNFSKEFIRYVFNRKNTWVRNYRSQAAKTRRCKEVQGYVLSVLDDIDFLQDRETIQPFWNRHVGNSSDAFDSFLNEVQNKCSSVTQKAFMSREDLEDIFLSPPGRGQASLCDFSSST